MTLQQLRDFLAVLEHGSLRAAARAMGVSQAGLTQSLQALEASLGAELLLRSGRGVQATAAGERLRHRARVIDAEARRAVSELVEPEAAVATPIRVGLSPTASALLLPLVVPQFLAQHPRAELRLMGGLFERLLPAVREGQLDFAVISLPDVADYPGMRTQVLMKTAMAVVGRKGHPLAGARRLRELAAQQWILMGPPGAPGGTVVRFFGEVGLAAPRIAVVCDSFTQVTALLGGSDYLALMPRLVLERQLLGPHLAEIPIVERARGNDVALVQRQGVALPAAGVELVAMLTSCARSLGKLA